jgi:hypothetical protein
VEAIDERMAELDVERGRIDDEIARAGEGLSGRDQAVGAMATDGSMVNLHEVRSAELAAREAELAHFRAQRAEFEDERKALVQRRREAEAGEQGNPRSHLHNDHHPQSTADLNYGRVVEIWSAISVSVGLIALIALLVLTDLPVWAVVLLAFGGYFVLEAAFRRQLINLLLRVALVLALVGAVVLAVDYAGELVILAVLGVALMTLVDNVREIRAG